MSEYVTNGIEPRDDLKRLDKKELVWVVSNEIMEYFDLFTFSDNEECFWFNGSIYQSKGESMIRQQTVAKLRSFATKRTINEVINTTKILSYIDRSEIKPPLNMICVGNGILDIVHERLYRHTPECKFFSKLPIHYNSTAECPKIEQFFREVFHRDDIPIIQELIGYLLWRQYHIHRAFLLIGDGANGKSTFLKLLEAFLGKENICSLALQDFGDNRFAAGQLYSKLANLYDDLTDESLKQTGKFKILTGGGFLSADRKFKDAFLFENYAKLIFATNKPPDVKDDTGAFWRRWIFLNFPNSFVGSQADAMKVQRLTTNGELSGLLNIAIAGLQRLLKKDDFSYRFTPEETRTLYKKAANSFFQFTIDRLTTASSDWIRKRKLYATYVDFCKISKLPAVAENTFARKLREHYGSSIDGQQRKSIPCLDHIEKPVWIGIKFKPKEDIENGGESLDGYTQ